MLPVGKVIAKEPGMVEVCLVRQSACQSCRSCSLGQSENEVMYIKAKDSFDAALGQQVQLYLPASQGLKASLLVYCFPILVLFASFLVIQYLFPGSSEFIPAFSSLVLSIGSLLLLRLTEAKRIQQKQFLPEVTALVETEN